MVVRHAGRVEPAHVRRVAQEERRERVAAEAGGAAVGRRRVESPEPLSGVRLQHAEAPHDHTGADADVVCAARVADRAGILLRAVVDLQRNPLRLAERGNRRRPHLHQRQSAGLLRAGIRIWHAEQIAVILVVVRAQRQDVRLRVVGLHLHDGRRVQDAHVVAGHVVRGGVVRSRVVAGCRSADDARRVDGVAADEGRRAQAWRQRVGLVVRISREDGVAIVEPVVDTDVDRVVVLGALVRERVVIGQPRTVSASGRAACT